METLEFKKRVLKINMYGESVELDFPTVKEFREFDKRKDDDQFEVMCEFIVGLGFPENKIEEIEPEHLTTIINTLVGNNEKK